MQPVHGSEALISLEKLQGYEERCRVRPGLTGLAQIYADRDIPRLINTRLLSFPSPQSHRLVSSPPPSVLHLYTLCALLDTRANPYSQKLLQQEGLRCQQVSPCNGSIVLSWKWLRVCPEVLGHPCHNCRKRLGRGSCP
jgi:hypothetical protein